MSFLPRALPVFLAALLGSTCSFFGDRKGGPAPAYKLTTTLSSIDAKIGEPFGLASRGGELYFSDGEKGEIGRLLPDGNVQTIATGLKTPSAIAFLADDTIAVADSGSQTIKRVALDGRIETIAGVEGVAGSADGRAARATFNGPIGLAVAADSAIYVADTYNDRIRVIREGVVSTLAGSMRGFSDGTDARFDTPLGLAVWQDKILVADSGNARIRVVEPTGSVWTLAGGGEEFRDGTPLQAGLLSPTAIAVSETGQIYFTDGNAVRAIGRRTFPFVETIAGDRRGHADGSSRSARFNRPSGLAFGTSGEIVVADSDSQVIRAISDGGVGRETRAEEIESRRISAAQFRELQPPRWPYDPPTNVREVAGTLGEIRGEIGNNKQSWFHNGLDIAGGYGEVAKFIRTETVLDPHSAQHFGTARELLRLPTVGYIHLRLGRDSRDTPLVDGRFVFDRDAAGRLSDVRVPRGARFAAGDLLGTLNSQNHVHLIAGRAGSEMNALAALTLPGASDGISPTIEDVSLYDRNWQEFETGSGQPRIKLGDNIRLMVRAYDRMDGNVERRRLGVYRVGYSVDPDPVASPAIRWTIVFDRTPPNEAVSFVYAPGSRSGARGETVFRYIASNNVNGGNFSEGFIPTENLSEGKHVIRVYVADFFGNTTSRDITFEVVR